MTRALDVLAGGRGGLDALPGLLEAGALLGEDQAPVLVLLLHDQGVDHLAEGDLLVGLHALADRQLGQRDDALALVADVDEDLVLVDADHPPGDDVPLGEERDRQVVVRHLHAVDLDVLGAVERADRGVEVQGLGLRGIGSADGDVGRPRTSAWRARGGQSSSVGFVLVAVMAPGTDRRSGRARGDEYRPVTRAARDAHDAPGPAPRRAQTAASTRWRSAASRRPARASRRRPSSPTARAAGTLRTGRDGGPGVLDQAHPHHGLAPRPPAPSRARPARSVRSRAP